MQTHIIYDRLRAEIGQMSRPNRQRHLALSSRQYLTIVSGLSYRVSQNHLAKLDQRIREFGNSGLKNPLHFK